MLGTIDAFHPPMTPFLYREVGGSAEKLSNHKIGILL
jgi:hypothetical protein